jgi:hypothetical protein
MAILPEIKSEAEHKRQRAIVDAASAYAESIMCEGGDKRRRNYLTKEEAAAPVYAACDNDMRGRVEQFELLTDPPESFVAYLGSNESRPIITVWTGLPLGNATNIGRVSGRHQHPRVFAYRAWMAGREYHGRSQGEGMCIFLRETAESKRKRESGK